MFPILPLGFMWCCCRGNCDACRRRRGPATFKVVVPADITNNVCTQCATLSGTHFLPHSSSILPWLPNSNCYWFNQHDTCGLGLAINLRVLSIPTYRVTVQFSLDYFDNSYMSWSKDYGATKPDCANFVDEQIPLVTTFGTACTSSSSLPLLLTAL